MTEPSRPDLHWQDKAGATWARLYEQTDTQLGPLGLFAIDRLAPSSGERVLDVGCGAGHTLLELARRVGPEGHVTALDIAEPMLRVAQARVLQAGFHNVDFVLADAGKHAFAATFDAIYSRFGVMFFEDSLAGFARLRGALRAEGRLGFVCWQSAEKNPWHAELLDAVRSVAPNHPMPEMLKPGTPGPFRFGSADELRTILRDAGFLDVLVEARELAMHFGGARTLDEAVAYALEIGPAARFVADADPNLRPAFEAALRTALAPRLSACGVWVGAAVHVVTARV